MTALSHVVLELAREPGHPVGDRAHRYDLHVPLTADGRIDAKAWRDTRAAWRVRRIRPGEQEAHARIIHGPGGKWTFDYTDASDRDDETGFRLGDERFVVGEYVSIREDDGILHTFQVIEIKPE